jgi:hypothetical protein
MRLFFLRWLHAGPRPLSATHADVGARSDAAQSAHEIDDNELLKLRADAAPRSIADFLPREP